MSDSHGGGGPPLFNVAEKIGHGFHDAGYHVTARPFVIAFVVLNVIFLIIDPAQTLRNWLLVGFFAPLWVPFFVAHFGWQQWVKSRRAEFIANQDTILLELRMPRDTKKTPLAMEAILSAFHMTSGESNNYAKYWQGKVRTWFSIEIVSIGGRIRFFIWMRKGLRRGIESAFYAQYPDMEIVEAEDYSLMYDPAALENDMFGDEFVHTKPDPYPIKTYVDYKLDQPGAKPEEIIDPMAQMIELLGSIGPKEQMWIQFVIRASKDEKYEGQKTKDGRTYTWKDHATDLIEKTRKDTANPGKYTDPVTGKVHETQGFPNPTKGQSDTMAAIERNIAKQGFDVGMRGIYTAPKEAYEGSMIGFMLGSMLKPFSSEAYNGFKPSAKFDARFNDYPWEDPGGHHRQHLHKEIVEFYRRRAFYHDPYVGEWMIMSTEELATLFHVPSAASRHQAFHGSSQRPPVRQPTCLRRICRSTSKSRDSSERASRSFFLFIREYERWIIGCALLLAAVTGTWLISAPTDFPQQSLVTIPDGSSAHSFGQTLADARYIRSEFLFRAFAHLTGFDHRLDTGAYAFSRPESLPVILWRLEKGQHDIAPIKVTITEGMTRFDIADALSTSIPGFDRTAFLTESSTSEGYLFPETYFFMPGDTPASIVDQLKAQFASSTMSISSDIASSTHSERDIVILASILEREAQSPEDMRVVAGILWNRIGNGMPLQVDASFGYAHQQNGYTPTAADLDSDSPYNTYRNRGLPPTAISNPGLAALSAAANPAKTTYVYYLTGTDGQMHYAVTFDQHKVNKAKYLK